MNGLGKELKETTAADIPSLWGNIERIRTGGALHAGNLATRTAASYAILAVEQRIGALMAEGLPTPPPQGEAAILEAGATELIVELPGVDQELISAGAGATS